MPIYEFSCQHCENSFEKLLLSSRETVACPRCESHAVERKLSIFCSPGNDAGKGMAGGGCGCTPNTCACH